MVRAVAKLMAPLARRVYLMIGRGVVRLVDDAGGLQVLQVTLLDGEPRRGLERIGQYGHASNPPDGAEAVVASVCGSRDHGVVIAVEHRRHRLKDLKRGESALYDDLGQRVHVTRDGIVIKSAQRATLATPEINLGGDRAELLALIDERILELINQHTHQDVQPGSGVSGTPVTPITKEQVCTQVTKAK